MRGYLHKMRAQRPGKDRSKEGERQRSTVHQPSPPQEKVSPFTQSVLGSSPVSLFSVPACCASEARLVSSSRARVPPRLKCYSRPRLGPVWSTSGLQLSVAPRQGCPARPRLGPVWSTSGLQLSVAPRQGCPARPRLGPVWSTSGLNFANVLERAAFSKRDVDLQLSFALRSSLQLSLMYTMEKTIPAAISVEDRGVRSGGLKLAKDRFVHGRVLRETTFHHLGSGPRRNQNLEESLLRFSRRPAPLSEPRTIF